MSIHGIKQIETVSATDKGCCYYLCKCLYVDEEPNKPNIRINLNNTTKSEQEKIIYHHVPHNQQTNLIHNNSPIEEDPLFLQAMESTKQFQIISQIPMHLIEYDITMKRDQLRDIIYNCPICLRYFSHILELSCCLNYICKFCADDYLSTMIKYQNVIKCPVCNSNSKEMQIVLTDVKIGSEVYITILID